MTHDDNPSPSEPMGTRGVTRPMPLEESRDAEDGLEGDGDRMDMLRRHHRHVLWIPWTVLLLGIWQLAAPGILGYLEPELWQRPSGGRGAWWSDATHDALRAQLMFWSDVATGLLLLIFGWRMLRPNRPVSWWICCGVGVWLNLAPLVFWAPTAASYLNDTLVGMLLIALTILIPGMPDMIRYMEHGPPRPPGWTYNPSSWPQRWIMIVTGFAGLTVSRYLAAFQLGYIDSVWEPFFGAGSERVLNSQMSHRWPISDAGLGAFSYTFEFLMGYMGSPARWRTMPWMVTFFGILVIPLGLTHIALVISQPVVVGAWCTMCLLAAAIMLPMIPLEVDEVVAMGQHLAAARRRGDRRGSMWTVFWKGGSAKGCEKDERSPALVELPQRFGRVFAASIWGMSFPWNLLAAAAIGLWLMFAPSAFGSRGIAADAVHLGGSLTLVVAVVACGEPIRAGRLLNVALGAGLAATLWFVPDANLMERSHATAAGIAVAILSLPRGPIRERYGTWDRFIR